MKTQHNHSIHREVIISCGVLLLCVAGGTAWWSWRASLVPVTRQPISSQMKKSDILNSSSINIFFINILKKWDESAVEHEN